MIEKVEHSAAFPQHLVRTTVVKTPAHDAFDHAIAVAVGNLGPDDVFHSADAVAVEEGNSLDAPDHNVRGGISGV